MPCQMLINYVPGEECRVAIVDEGKLEEFHAESASSLNRVGNIYTGRVSNVESGIQAAFVDFGVEQAGFLHVSDLHPRYFPGEETDTTETIGKKVPRRDRPPIQQCLKRGQDIIVQVIKDGVGSKGPTLTSYLSIPGRFLVMMPQMDRVGVSRKVEDEDQRKAMRKILDQLDLPESFGFILRTAGFDRTKTELKRDLAYLVRLWKDMQRRLKVSTKPSLLYCESDLLVRALRDLMNPDIQQIVIDSDRALSRASKFLKIAAPRAQAQLMHYTGEIPLFHAYGVEPQIETIHSREVHLPSGGRLVIDETEALVAIDVNSGKMRSAKDAETNAFKVNLEAVDEICRQLRLRDMGGLVVNDLIDMRKSENRRKIEQRFRERLKRDRANTMTLPISSFGILEMTRQRMRASQESLHFADCPTCQGRGLIRKAQSVAASAMRDLTSLLSHQRVHHVELVISPRVAGDLLTGRRQFLTRIERQTGKQVHVRVSETIAMDRIAIYAYDAQGSDLDVQVLIHKKSTPAVEQWDKDSDDNWAQDITSEQPDAPDHAEETVLDPFETSALDEADEAEKTTRKKRRRRRRGKKETSTADAPPPENESARDQTTSDQPEPVDESAKDETSSEPASPDDESNAKTRSRRRRRRRSRKSASTETQSDEVTASESNTPAQNNTQSPEDSVQAQPATPEQASSSTDEPQASSETSVRKKRRRSKRSGKSSNSSAPQTEALSTTDNAPTEKPASDQPRESKKADDGSPSTIQKESKPKRTRKKSSKKTSRSSSTKDQSTPSPTPPTPTVEAGPRLLYSSRRKLTASERAKAATRKE